MRDIVQYLPASKCEEFRRGSTIMETGQPNRFFRIGAGIVTVLRENENGLIGLEFLGPDEYFGEDVLVYSESTEKFLAHNRVCLQSWTADQIDEAIQRCPPLRCALLREIVAKEQARINRVEKFALYPTHIRTPDTLLCFVRKFGKPDGEWLEAPPISQDELACFAGTQRTAVTCALVRWRQTGLVEYSRMYMRVRVWEATEDLDNLVAAFLKKSVKCTFDRTKRLYRMRR